MAETITFELPSDVAQRLRAQTPDLAEDAKVAYALSLFRSCRLNHFQLSQLLNLDRFETDALLKRHGVTEQSLTLEELDADRETLRRVLGPGKS